MIDTPAAEEIINKARRKESSDKIKNRRKTPKPLKIKRASTEKSPMKRQRSKSREPPRRSNTEKTAKSPDKDDHDCEHFFRYTRNRPAAITRTMTKTYWVNQRKKNKRIDLD